MGDNFLPIHVLPLKNATLWWTHTAEDATHIGKNLTSVSALKTPPKTFPFPDYFMTKGGQFCTTKGPCFSLYQQYFGTVI